MTTSDSSTSNMPEIQALKSTQDVETALREINGQEQLYSIALFDILGFSNFVEQNGNHAILDLYTKLLEIIHAQESAPDGTASRAGRARRKILCKRFSTKSRLALQKRSSLPAESLAPSIPPRPGRYARRWRRECRPGGGGS